ncbi:MAG: dephospho-CoA kinase [Pirellulales bacterium]
MIGLVGGIASGKSLVAESLKSQGAAVVSADALAHEVLDYDEVKRAARQRWGDAIFTPAGDVDRAALAKIVFAPPPDGPRERKHLEQLIHPEVGRLIGQRLEALQRDGRTEAIVLDVPLLVESGWNKLCDAVVYVEAPREQRLSRAMARGWPAEDFERREAAQETLAQKREQADLVIDNSGSLEATRSQVEQFWRDTIEATPRS